jgi:hypothetical protein
MEDWLMFSKKISETLRLASGLAAALLLLTGVASGQWTEKVIYSFVGFQICYDAGQAVPPNICPPYDGQYPAAGLVFDHSGRLWGTTVGGGPIGLGGDGTLFDVTEADGIWGYGGWSGLGVECLSPHAGVVSDSSGNLYGTTAGCVFRQPPPGYMEMLSTDAGSYSGVALDAADNVYGVSQGSGSPSCASEGGCGFVFKLTSAATYPWTETVLYSFTGGADGAGKTGTA